MSQMGGDWGWLGSETGLGTVGERRQDHRELSTAWHIRVVRAGEGLGVFLTRTKHWCTRELPFLTVHLDMTSNRMIFYCFLHQAPTSFTMQSGCYSSASFSLFSVMALHPIYCSLFKPCSKDRIINFLMGCSSWALIITVLHK